MSKGIVAPENEIDFKNGYNYYNKGEFCVDLQNMQLKCLNTPTDISKL